MSRFRAVVESVPGRENPSSYRLPKAVLPTDTEARTTTQAATTRNR